MSRALVLVALVGCASAGETTNIDAQPKSDGAIVDGKRADAAASNPCAFTGALATYTFAGEAGNQAQTAATSKASGITAGPIKRAATLTATSGAASINASNWPTTAQVDPTKFYTLTLTPPAGCMMSLTSIAIDVKSSGTGPATGALATSSDNFATFKPVSTGTPSTPAVAMTTTSALEVRVYGYSASSTSGTMRVQGTLTINGSMQ
jgi:hypothetical protein